MSETIQNLINSFSKLPGVGQKTAERFVFYLLKKDKAFLQDFANSLISAKERIKACKNCGQFSENDTCRICSDRNRDNHLLCVVAESADIGPLEKSGQFKGIYFVLGGLVNPTEGMTAESLHVKKLLEKIQANGIVEVILGLNPTIEGETTALFLTKLLKKHPNIKVTKLARGLPQGADLEYADEITLANAFKGRVVV